MNLANKKELAAKVLGVGKNRVYFVEDNIPEIKEAITRQDIIDLYNAGAIQVKEVKDVTGCGDAFASAFIIEYLKSQNAENAAKYANLIAARNTQFIGTDELRLLKSGK